jgi:hypothetical protein
MRIEMPAGAELVIGPLLKDYPLYESKFDAIAGDGAFISREFKIVPKTKPQTPPRRFKSRPRTKARK